MTTRRDALRYALVEYGQRLLGSDFETLQDEGKHLYALLVEADPKEASVFRDYTRTAHEDAQHHIPSQGWLSDTREERTERAFIRWT